MAARRFICTKAEHICSQQRRGNCTRFYLSGQRICSAVDSPQAVGIGVPNNHVIVKIAAAGRGRQLCDLSPNVVCFFFNNDLRATRHVGFRPCQFCSCRRRIGCHGECINGTRRCTVNKNAAGTRDVRCMDINRYAAGDKIADVLAVLKSVFGKRIPENFCAAFLKDNVERAACRSAAVNRYDMIRLVLHIKRKLRSKKAGFAPSSAAICASQKLRACRIGRHVQDRIIVLIVAVQRTIALIAIVVQCAVFRLYQKIYIVTGADQESSVVICGGSITSIGIAKENGSVSTILSLPMPLRCFIRSETDDFLRCSRLSRKCGNAAREHHRRTQEHEHDPCFQASLSFHKFPPSIFCEIRRGTYAKRRFA